NYDVIRNVLLGKYGIRSAIIKSLYNDVHPIKEVDRKWMTTVETMERALRQLEMHRENLEHSSIEIAIESILLNGILENVYQQHEEDPSWLVMKLSLQKIDQ
ncbi:hypothetical protein LOAG_14705, partial [Loa loa]